MEETGFKVMTWNDNTMFRNRPDMIDGLVSAMLRPVNGGPPKIPNKDNVFLKEMDIRYEQQKRMRERREREEKAKEERIRKKKEDNKKRRLEMISECVPSIFDKESSRLDIMNEKILKK